MVEQKELRRIIEQVLTEMSIGDGHTPPAKGEISDKGSAPDRPHTTQIEIAGCIDDITEVDLKKQYLVKNPVNGEAYLAMKQHTPSRVGIGKAGARYKTETMLRFRADHSAAQDAVFSDVDSEFVDKMGLFTVQTLCENKDMYLTRPDLGKKLNEDGVKMVKDKCKKNPTVQIFVADGLSSASVKANIADLLPSIIQGLKSSGIEAGTPFFVKLGRVGVMDEVSELVGADVTCVLIGERPGLITAHSMSAYIAYKATVNMPEARRTVVSNIHNAGTPAVEAGAHVAHIIKLMLEKKASGTDLRL